MEVVEAVLDTTAATPDARRASAPGPSPRATIIGALVVVVTGVAVVHLGLVALGDVDGTIKVPSVLAGAGLVLAGADRMGKAIWGPWFDTGYWLSIAWLLVLTAATALADLLPIAEHKDITKTLSVPGNARPDLFSENPLGTNNFSLDLLAQSIYGARVSLATALFAAAVGLVIGGAIGMVAGYFRGNVDIGVAMFTDALLSFPPLIGLIAVAALLGIPDTVPEAVLKSGIALAVVSLPTMVRLSRANTMVFAQREFVVASRAMGAKHARVILRELLPNVALPVVSYAFVILAVLIIAEGSLSFLGLGLQQPEPTWGNMIAETDLASLRQYPHIPLVPGAFMFLTVYAFNRVGERARSLMGARDLQV